MAPDLGGTGVAHRMEQQKENKDKKAMSLDLGGDGAGHSGHGCP
jgi:hypothetical protein